MSYRPALVAALNFLVCGQLAAGQGVVSSWFPIQPGDEWIYQHESRGGNIDHPYVERRKTGEVIVSSVAIPEGIFLTKKTTAFEHIEQPDYGNSGLDLNPHESYYLVHQGCLYSVGDSVLDKTKHLTPGFRKDLMAGEYEPDFCFPLLKGKTWGSHLPEEQWKVLRAYTPGADGKQIFLLYSFLGAGVTDDVWFKQGIGVLQETTIHHGTYDETDDLLLRATINRQRYDFCLTHVRAIPTEEDGYEGVGEDYDCDSIDGAGVAGWRYYAREDGSLFENQAACNMYVKSHLSKLAECPARRC